MILEINCPCLKGLLKKLVHPAVKARFLSASNE